MLTKGNFGPNSKNSLLDWLGVDTGPIYRPTRLSQCCKAAFLRHMVPSMPVEAKEHGARKHLRDQLYAQPKPVASPTGGEGESVAQNTTYEVSWSQAFSMGAENMFNIFLWPLVLLDSIKYGLFGLIDLGAKTQQDTNGKVYYETEICGEKRHASPLRSTAKAILEMAFWLISAPFRLFALLPNLLGKCINILSRPKEASWLQLAGAVFGALICGAGVAALIKGTAGIAVLPKVMPYVAKAIAFLGKALTVGKASLSAHVATVTAKVCLFGSAVATGFKLLAEGLRSAFCRRSAFHFARKVVAEYSTKNPTMHSERFVSSP